MERLFVECAVRAAVIAVVTAVVLRAIGMPSPGAYGTAVQLLGTEAQAQKLIPDLLATEKKGAIGWSEVKPKAGTFSTVAEEQADGRFRSPYRPDREQKHRQHDARPGRVACRSRLNAQGA